MRRSISRLSCSRNLRSLGLIGVLFPEEYGGAGMGYVEYATIIEELSRVDGSVGISVAAHNSLCSNHIYQFGTEAQKQKYLVPLATRRASGAWGLTEPSAGSDASGTRSTAVRKDGGWIVNGSKNFITHAIHADTCVALAVTDRAKRSKGISAFIFEKGMKGFAPSKKENKLGLRASETASVVFEDCFVPDENRLGEEGQGFVNAMEILDGGRISIAALAVGIAQGAYESAVRYAQERQQFGKPIAEFQAIQFKLANMAMQIDAARLLMYRAAWHERPRQEDDERVFDGQAVRFGNECERLRRSDSGSRRLRLHERLSGGEILARFKALHHRRRHFRNSTNDHCARNSESCSADKSLLDGSNQQSSASG